MKKYTKRILSVLIICCMAVMGLATVASASGGTNDARLATLEISPGTLTPEFSPDVYEYSVNVDSDCDKLLVDAGTMDSGARMVIAGNSSLQAGTNSVLINVTAADGVTTARYTITVTRAAGENESTQQSTAETSEAATGADDEIPSDPLIVSGHSDGETAASASSGTVTSAGRTFTLSEPSPELVPSGFTETDVTIGDQTVKGWTFPSSYEADGFYLLYGTDQDGNASFLIYDQDEGTLITAPVGFFSMGQDSAIYQNQIRNNQESYQKTLRQRMWIIIALTVVCVILLIALTASLTRHRHDREDLPEENETDPDVSDREMARRYEEDDYDSLYDDEDDGDYEDYGNDEPEEEPEEQTGDESVNQPEWEDAPADDFELLDLDEDIQEDPGKEVPEEKSEEGEQEPEEISQLQEDDLEEIEEFRHEEDEEPEKRESDGEEEDDLDADFSLLDALLSDSVRNGKPESADSIVNRAAEKAGRTGRRTLKKSGDRKLQNPQNDDGDDDFEILDL